MASWRIIGYYFKLVLYFMSISIIPPFIAAIILSEKPLFILAIGLEGLLLFLTCKLLSRITSPGDIGFTEALVLTALTFLLGGFVAGIPIIVYDEPINALFEGISAITTTGLSSLNQNSLTPGVHFLRSYYQWIGGLGIALLTVSFLVSPGSAAYNIYAAHLGKTKIKPLSLSTVRVLLKIYIILTIAYLILYIASGLNVFDALINSLTTISTGGFSTITLFDSPKLMIVGFIGMFISAQPLIMYYYLYRGNLKRILNEKQLYSFTIILLSGFLALTLVDHKGIIQSLFQAVSALSTTGYSALNNNSLSDSSKLILSILMITGASLGSTGGGLKQLRIIILFKTLLHNIKTRLYPPKTVRPLKINNTLIDSSTIISILSLTTLYIIVLLFSTWIFTIHGYTLSNSLFESSSALATTGLSTGITGPRLSCDLKIVLMIDMLLGRVEIIPYIYLIIYPLRDRI